MRATKQLQTSDKSTSRKRILIALGVVALAAPLALFLGRTIFRKSLIPAGLKGSLNVVLLTIDTLRADRLGCYGSQRVATPNIDRLAAEGTRFEMAVAQVPLTLPSHASIFTGTYPTHHGVRDNGSFYLDGKHETVAEVMKAGGWKTGAFVGAFVVDSRWGLDQGFDDYHDNFDLTKFKKIGLDTVQRRGDEVLKEAVRWIGENSTAKFFAWVHLYDPHTPYDPPEPFKTRYQGGPYSLYDGEVAYVDSLVGEFLAFLEEKGLAENTLIVLTGDHGESLGEHKESAHGFFVYDAAIRVPLIIRLPGGKAPRGRIVGTQVLSIDIMPTILALTGAPVPAAVQGRSLMPLLAGGEEKEDVPAYSETNYPLYHYGWSGLMSYRQGRYKFIDAPSPELYNVFEDPGEQHNLVDRQASLALRMKRDLDGLISRISAAEVIDAGPRTVDQDTLVKLQALGYIGSFRKAAARKPGESLADPKDRIELYNEIKLSQFLISEDKLDRAEEKLRDVLARDPSILEGRFLLGHLLFTQKRYEEAAAEYRRALEADPDYSEAIFGLALVYKETRKDEEAIFGLRRLIDIDPRDTKPYFHLTDIYQDRGDLEAALQAIQAAVALDPESRFMRNRLGAVYLEMKRYDEAEREIRAALAMERSLPLLNAHFNMALIHEARGDLAQAVAEYRREQETSPFNFKPDYNLGLLFLKTGDLESAERELRSCVRKNEEFAPALVFLAKALMDKGGDLKEAEALALRGLGLGPDQSTSVLGHFLLADIYSRLGNPAASAEHLEAARLLRRSRTAA